MSQAGLSVSDVVNVTINIEPNAAGTLNFGTAMVIGSSNVIDVVSRYRSYTTLTGVAADFGTTAPEYLAADNFFSQIPQPNQLYIGRWAQTATAGLLVGAVLSTAQQALTNFTSITSGGMSLTVNGTVVNLTAMNFTAATNLNGVAAVITTALTTHGSCNWDGNNFNIVSPTTGATSTVTFATPPGTGTDVSALLGLQSASGGYLVPGVVAELPVAAITALQATAPFFYFVGFAPVTALSDSQVETIAAFIEGNTNIFGQTITNPAAITSATNDLGSVLAAANYSRTMTQYSSSDSYAIWSLIGRNVTTSYSGNNTVITNDFKTEPGVTAETLSETQAGYLLQKNINVFVNYANGTAIVQPGVVAGGRFIDEVVGLDALANQVQTDLFNTLYQTPTKIPQTDAGVNQLLTAMSGSLAKFVTNGLLAGGVWTGPPIGTLQTGQTLSTGFYVYAPPIATQDASDRAARISPTLQAAIKLAGAIQSISCTIDVNR